MNLKLIFVTGLFAIGFAFSATAGSIVDTDGDGIPDVFDNCEGIPITTRANDAAANFDSDGDGLGDGCDNCSDYGLSPSQTDTDGDGIGNFCDADFDNNGVVTSADAGLFLPFFPGGTPGGLDLEYDMDGNGTVTSGDAALLLGYFPGGTPGPSGYGCADATSATPGTCTAP
jgi:hypothetical protein